MNTDRLIAVLSLPPESRVDQRVPKELLVENVAPTDADRRQTNEKIEELLWLAALKPTTILLIHIPCGSFIGMLALVLYNFGKTSLIDVPSILMALGAFIAIYKKISLPYILLVGVILSIIFCGLK